MLPEEIRIKILDWIKEGIKYDKIVELVKNEGYSITKGGITYVKSHPPKIEKKKKKEEKTKQKTKQEIKKIENKDLSFKNAFEVYHEGLLKEGVNIKLLTDLEFKSFKESLNIIIKSSESRFIGKNYKSTGMLNALYVCRDTLEIMEKRGNYK